MAKKPLPCILKALFLISLIWGCCPLGRANNTTACFPYEWVGRIEGLNLEGPSGIVYHQERRSLFVVGDRGDICEITRDGDVIKRKKIRNADFEGITYNPSSGLLYIAVEGEENIIEIDPADFRVLREYSIDRAFKGTTVLKAGGDGVEAITFVPNSHRPEGGTFYIANQGFDLEDTEDPSAIFELHLPLQGRSSGGRARIIRGISFNAIDLSGLSYDRLNGRLYAISGVWNTLFEITMEGVILETYTLPGDNQEGIAVDERGILYIAQDSGGIVTVQGLKEGRRFGSR